MVYIDSPIIVSFTAIWMGFVMAISFMEAWLKFRAEGVTKTIGLGIGRLVFTALNRVELFCCTVIVITLMLTGLYTQWSSNSWIYAVILILLVQTFYYLPLLHQRIDRIKAGETVESSTAHAVYVVLEVLKLILLTIYLITRFQ